MKITFEITPYSNPDALAEWLQALGYGAERIKPDSSGHEVAEVETLLLGYHHPETALQAAMQQGEPPMQAMQNWAEKARQLVDMFKRNRRRATLINLGDLYQAPHEACQQLITHWDTNGKSPKQVQPLPDINDLADAGGAGSNQAQIDGTTLRLLAREAVRQLPQWPELSTQLEACSLPLLDEANVDGRSCNVSLDTQFQGVHARLQATQEQRQESDNASHLLLEQLHHVQEELEQALNKNHTLNQQHGSLSAEKAALQKQLDERSAEARKLTQRLESQNTAKQQADKRLQGHEAKQKERQSELKKVQQAHKSLLSEKATLDKQLEVLKKEANNQAELEQENHLLLEQLHIVQEELERSILAGQEKADQVQQTTHQHQLLQQRLNKVVEQRLLYQQQLEEEHQKARTAQRQLEANERQYQQRLQQESEHHQQMQEHLQQRLNKLRSISEASLNDAEKAKAQLAEQRLSERSRMLVMAAELQNQARGEGRQARKKIKRDHKLITQSELFDHDWYLKQYSDVAKANIDPLTHYLEVGAGEGRNPSAEFDTAWYLLTYHDVAVSGLNPLVHFVRFGRQEQRTPHPNLPALPAPAKAADNVSH